MEESVYILERFSNLMYGQLHVIVECGSRDCLDAIQMEGYYTPDIIYSFECNPESIPVCESNIRIFDNIKLIPKAVYNEDTMVKFYSVDMERSVDKNIGASSLLKLRDRSGGILQNEIEVEGIRLDTFMKQEGIKKIDLLCMDLQGAEHIAIEGLGDKLKYVHYIISEVSSLSFYHGDMLEVNFIKFMKDRGFKAIKRYKGNVLFKNLEWRKTISSLGRNS